MQGVLSVYRALLSVYRALLSVYRALLSVYRVLLSVYRALVRVYISFGTFFSFLGCTLSASDELCVVLARKGRVLAIVWCSLVL